MSARPLVLALMATLACASAANARSLSADAPAPAPAAAPSTYLYAWSGPDTPGPDCRDAVVVLDGTPESSTFGKVVNVTFVPTWGKRAAACTRMHAGGAVTCS